MLRIVLVDDSQEFLNSSQRLLSGDPESLVAGCVTSGQDALKKIQELRPELVLMDLSMPGLNGLDATRIIKAQRDAPRVVIVTAHDSPEFRAEAAAAQADGFITKSEFAREIFPLIRRLFPRPPKRSATVSCLTRDFGGTP